MDNYFIKHVSKILKIQADATRNDRLDALKRSVEAVTQPASENPSPADINKEFGITYGDQLSFGIAVDKKEGIEFLEKNGKPMTLAVLRKNYGGQVFKTLFGREVAQTKKRHIYTYAELMVFVDHPIPNLVDKIDEAIYICRPQ